MHAFWLAAGMLGLGFAASLLVPRRRTAAHHVSAEPALERAQA